MSSSDDSSSDSESDDEMRRNIMASYYGKGLNEQVREKRVRKGSDNFYCLYDSIFQ